MFSLFSFLSIGHFSCVFSCLLFLYLPLLPCCTKFLWVVILLVFPAFSDKNELGWFSLARESESES